MVHKKWSFISNPFLVVGGRNCKKAFDLAKYTDAALNARTADPFFSSLYAFFHPLYLTLEAEYSDWKSQSGIQGGATLTLNQLLVQLGLGDKKFGITSKINDWSLAVQNVFRKGTPSYAAILPQGHAAFQKGSKDSRIAAVAALSISLAGYPALAILKMDVDAFLTSLNAARLVQQGKISDTATDSDEVRAAVTNAMKGMFAVYGGLIQHFFVTPGDVEPFFDLQLLRSLPQSLFTGTVDMMKTKNVTKRTLADNRKIKFTVLTNRELQFYVADEKNDVNRERFITVPGLEEEIVEWGAIKNKPTATFLHVFNGHSDLAGHFKIEILPER